MVYMQWERVKNEEKKLAVQARRKQKFRRFQCRNGGVLWCRQKAALEVKELIGLGCSQEALKFLYSSVFCF